MKLFKKGDSQAVRIPREFQLSGAEAVRHREGARLIIETPGRKRGSLKDLLATLDPLDEEFGRLTNLRPNRSIRSDVWSRPHSVG